MSYTKSFSELGKESADSAGGKGASLGEMTQAGIPVPPGYVVLAATFDRFIHDTDLVQEIEAVLGRVDHHAVHTVDQASETIQNLIIAAPMPQDVQDEIMHEFKKLGTPFVAVRSSATAEDGADHAWAGQLETFLNTTEKDLIEKVKECWASLFTPRAIFYRFEKGLHDTHISVAVVVQKMVNSEKAGIAFSVHPVTEDPNQMIIEAGLGLGEAVVSGAVTPDAYVIEKDTMTILDVNVNEQLRALYRNPDGGNVWQDLDAENAKRQVLSARDIMKLAEIIMKIENHYGFPCDIEWAYESGEFYITQSRPITTLKKTHSGDSSSHASMDSVELVDRPWKLVITRNMSFFHQVMSCLGHYHFSNDFGVTFQQQQLGYTYEGTQTSMFVENDKLVEYGQAVMRAVATADDVDQLKRKYEEGAKRILDAVAKVTKNTSIEAWNEFTDAYTHFSAALFLTSVIGRSGATDLMKLLEEEGYATDEAGTILGYITYPSEHTPLMQSQLDLLEIATKVQMNGLENEELELSLENWLEKHGVIPVNWCDDPWTLEDAQEQLSDLLQKDCATELERIAKDHQDKIVQGKMYLEKIHNEKITTLAHALSVGTLLNEYRKNVFSRVSLAYRPVLRHVAALLGSDIWRDCFYLMPDEIARAISGEKIDLQSIKNERLHVGYWINDQGEIDFLSEEDLSKVRSYVEAHQGKSESNISSFTKELKGFTANKGLVQGIARVVISSKDFKKVNRGDILVATMTSVDFVPIMERAGAFVTNEGGITSHAAIVSREMNKPCIIGTSNATQVIKDGDRVEVDANNGIVRILS